MVKVSLCLCSAWKWKCVGSEESLVTVLLLGDLHVCWINTWTKWTFSYLVTSLQDAMYHSGVQDAAASHGSVSVGLATPSQFSSPTITLTFPGSSLIHKTLRWRFPEPQVLSHFREKINKYLIIIIFVNQNPYCSFILNKTESLNLSLSYGKYNNNENFRKEMLVKLDTFWKK